MADPKPFLGLEPRIAGQEYPLRCTVFQQPDERGAPGEDSAVAHAQEI